MSESTSRRGLWLPVLALLIAGGAAVFAVTYEWGEPPPPTPAAETRRTADAGPVSGPLDAPPTPAPDEPKDAEAPADAEPEPAPIVVEAPEGVVAPEGEGIVGILVDADGNSVSRARIQVSRNLEDLARDGTSAVAGTFRISAGGHFGFGREAGVTDRQGRFAIKNPGKDGRYDITFNHPDHPAHTVTGIAWTRESRVDLGVVRIPAGGVIFGFVRDESGRPIAGARVRRADADGGRSSVSVATHVVSIAMGGADGEIISFGGSGGELTDAEGYFEMTKVPPGTYTLKAGVKGKAEASREGVIVSEGGRSGPISLVPSAGLEVSGTVVDEHGQPVGGAMVMAFSGGNNRSTRTDDRGAFRLTALAPGKVQLTVMGGGRGGMMWGGGGTTVTKTVDAGTSGVRLVLSQGLVLAGRLVDAVTGNPANGARITLVTKQGSTHNRRVTMAMNGAFRFASQKPGDYTIEVSANGYRKTTEGPFTLVEGRSIEDILIRLQPE